MSSSQELYNRLDEKLRALVAVKNRKQVTNWIWSLRASWKVHRVTWVISPTVRASHVRDEIDRYEYSDISVDTSDVVTQAEVMKEMCKRLKAPPRILLHSSRHSKNISLTAFTVSGDRFKISNSRSTMWQ